MQVNKRSLFGILFLLAPFCLLAQGPASIREYEASIITYPFSEPDPVPNTTGIYPYFRFDGFTDKPEKRKWKIVELDNDYVKVIIMPQIGGKIWTAIDKGNGKPFIYNNDVIKFRDIAMRGPWTSGGVEFNYGIFGHTPGVATPVNYLIRKNADSSVSCVLSLLDLLTETRWSLEIRLPKDKAYFITRSVWHNNTPMYQPYYTWTNLGERVSDSLEYIFPGNHYIYHDGKSYSWPYDEGTHKNISIYNQNNFGSYKSYHVTGVYSTYYGAFWQRQNFGMIHYARREDKIGKKIWIWGLSGQGMIWEKILTDHGGQYTELQSGRLFNQNAPESVSSPFKQFYFMPYSTDSWSEYWYPFRGTGGVTFADLNGVVNLTDQGTSTTIRLSPVGYINDTLKVFDTKDAMIARQPLKLRPLESFVADVPLDRNKKIGKITFAGSIINVKDSSDKILDRPLSAYPGFDSTSAYGLYIRGQYAAGTRYYALAEKYIGECIAKEPYFMPALTTMSFLQYREMNFDSAFYYARTALSIDTYDPAANYYYGLSALKMHRDYDAEDGFEVATITPQFRSAAYTELCSMKLREKQYKDAYRYAGSALAYNEKNITALQLRFLAAEGLGVKGIEGKIRARILKLDPLNHFIRFEKYWRQRTLSSRSAFTKMIRDELPQQTYLQLADWYMQLDLPAKGRAVLEVAPEKDDEMKYWLAYLHREDKGASAWLDSANAGNPFFVFPFRVGSATVMRWAMGQTDDWKPGYYLALIDNFRGHREEALHLLTKISDSVHFPPFYVIRAELRDSSDLNSIIRDFTTAISLNKTDWRYGRYLTEYLLANKRNAGALRAIEPYYKRDPANYVVGMLYIRCLMANNKYRDAEKVLGTIHVLPFEGAVDGRRYYEKTKLMLALGLLQDRHYQLAFEKVNEARDWPANLGVGKPYRNMIDSSLEDALEKIIDQARRTHILDSGVIEVFRSRIQAADRLSE